MGEVSSSVKKYVEANDVESTRIALTTVGYIADKASFNSFKTSTEYAIEHIDNLFEPDDNEDIDSSVTRDSYKKIMKQLMNNFSEKKYKAIVKVGTKLFANEAPRSEPATKDIKRKNVQKEEELDPFLTKKASAVQDVLDLIIQNPTLVLVVIVVLVVILVLIVR